MTEQQGAREVVVAAELLSSQSDKNRCHAFPFPHATVHLERTHACTRVHTRRHRAHSAHKLVFAPGQLQADMPQIQLACFTDNFRRAANDRVSSKD